MRRVACLLLCLALCCALFACGRAGPIEPAIGEITTTAETESSTEAETTTETPTTEEPLIPHPWRTPEELALSETITIYEVFNNTKPYPGGFDIWLCDSETGEEALLLEVGELEDLGLSSFWTPDLGIRLSERYFTFSCHLPETCDSTEVMFYDVAQRRVIEIDAPGCKMCFYKTENGRIYLYNALSYDEDDDWDDRVPAFYFDISALDSGEPIVVKELDQ